MFSCQDIDQVTWSAFVGDRADINFLHSWQWGELHVTMGHQVFRRGIYKDGKIVGVLLAITKNARRGRYLEVPGGPIINWQDLTIAEYTVQELRSIARSEQCVFVRVRPQLQDGVENTALFKRLGFKRAQMHLHAEHTNILDIQPDNEMLLAAMRRQTRYEIRRAEKNGIRVSHGTSESNLREFFETQKDTAQRQGFIPPSYDFLREQVRAFDKDTLRIYRAEKDGVLLSLAVVIFYGQEADYHEGASTLEGRTSPGAYAIQWRAIQDAKDKNIRRYNFFGIAPHGKTKHRYAGVTTFKRGFGGEDYTYLPAHDLVINKLRYVKNWTIEYARKKIRRL